MSLLPIKTHRLTSFDDPMIGRERWNGLLQESGCRSVFLTWEWQQAWWQSFGRGQLLLVAAEVNGEIVALAPFFAEAGMIYFVGSGGSDYLDFIGQTAEAEVVVALLEGARQAVPNFIGFVFYHLPESSPSLGRLEEAAQRLGLACFDEGELVAPALEWSSQPEVAVAAANKKSLVRHERSLRREGRLDVCHWRTGEEILPQLDEFFGQHRARWQQTPFPSLFCEPAQCAFYQRLTTLAGETGWLRFTRIDWNGRAIAFHFGFCYRGRFLWYKPSFDIAMARHSPGEVLLRQLLLAAIEEGAHTFDFGLGEEAFKSRFANRVQKVRTLGAYAPSALPSATVAEGRKA